jgi:4-hydroxysphinganine ceramide fatty acyl 2-hydroxylase
MLPTIPQLEIQSHNNAKSCYVTIGTKVYDVTDFVADHPGGAEFILDHAGKDVEEIMKDEYSHFHSESAYDILDEHHIGYVATEPLIDAATRSGHPDDVLPLPPNANGRKVLQNGEPRYAATGMSSADDLSRETDIETDYKTHKFLDLNKPLLMQVWRGGFTKKFYLEQVHRPRHYRGGDSAPLFGNFLEPLSKTPWWVIPTLWLPQIAFGLFVSARGLSSPLSAAGYFGVGLSLWTLIEYTLHRFLFHLDE